MVHMAARYPIPTSPPEYGVAPAKVSAGRRIGVYSLFDGIFILISIVLTFWYAGLLLVNGIAWSPWIVLYFLVFWAIVSYLGLPRLHQLFTLFYVPDYFIGRSRTGDGLLGDPINLALDGSEADIHAAMQRAGWTLADEITLRSAWRMIKSALLRRSYPEAPVSGLHLFGKRHAFAYQQEVDGNPHRRHHVRFWPVPQGWSLPGGGHVDWLAAGTYDRSVGLSAFTLQITHKIDEDIDRERDYIVNTVRYADPEVGIHVFEEFSTAYHHRNGGGDRIRTDGNLPVLEVDGASRRHPTYDTPETREQHHHLPPPQLVVAVAMIVLQAIVFSVFWWGIGVEGSYADSQDAGAGWAINTFGTAMVTVPVLLAGLTIARVRWAKMLLMAFIATNSVIELAEASATARAGATTVIIASFSVIVLLALTAGPVREWVGLRRGGVEEKPEPTVNIT
ncbi:MAG TPA: LssY C-terminal domain-containing protein [Tessaracoccus flavescens]|uniref:LssY C-terminal domain-containing protein n=1 Tax=Tessaracoccus flavescens TaxID=399497 RepID=A0A921JQB8_9ACTN|nr:LssY C-terminal domain-containing protein [Tessaracoccus flavescens]